MLNMHQLIRELWNIEKENYPGMRFEQFEEICSIPMKFTKKNLEDPTLPTVRLMYFGVFAVFEGKIENILRRLENTRKRGRKSDEKVDKIKAYYEGILHSLRPVNKIILIDDTEVNKPIQEIEV